jgi:ubiquinol-cytochrome c reductase cytochrome c1 subunit
MKKLLAVLLFVPFLAALVASPAARAEEGYQLDHAPDLSNDQAALQSGAKLFVNYCLNCHNASSMRYSRLADLKLTDDQIKKNLLFTSDKIGDLMRVAMPARDAKEWFGAVPPDLSVIARAKSSERGSGPDYIYSYLRTYYKDDTRPTGWNNLAYPNSAMPHILWQLQGTRVPVYVDKKDEEGNTEKEFERFDQVTPGTMTPLQYDKAVAEITAYLTWMAEPAEDTRKRIGVVVLLFLAVTFIFVWRLNATYWKDVK